MPKRHTTTYSSEDAPVRKQPGNDLFVYYCKYSGKHVLTTDADLSRAPRRRTDSSRVIDTKQYSVRLYTSAAEIPVVVQRPGGSFERQYRQYSAGKLPVAYRSEPDGKFLYVLDGACTTFSLQDREAGVPVPPCIRDAGGNTVEVLLEISDRGSQMKIMKISADICKVQQTKGIAAEDANEQLLEYIRSVLDIRFSDVTLLRGSSARQKRLLVSGLAPRAVYQKLQAAL